MLHQRQRDEVRLQRRGTEVAVVNYTAKPIITIFGVSPAELTPGLILYADSTDLS